MIRQLHDPKHIHKLTEYGKRWHERSVMNGLPFSTKQCGSLLRSAFMSPDMRVFASFDEKQNIQGVLIAAICTYPFFDAQYVTDIVFIADKEGDKLFAEMERWARSHKVHCIQMGVTSGLPEAGNFYKAKGLELIGGTYWRRL